jgi:hypothetical protein
MAEMKWTPGPWGVNKYGSVGAGAHYHVPIVASVEPLYGVDQCFGSHAANARLIAAAPELYKALTALMKIGPRPWMEGAQVTWETWIAAYEAAERALAKARGEP